MKKKNLQAGFTLVELLAVIIVFSVVASIVAGILVTSLRTSNKTTVLSTVKQNGNFALSQMSKVIRDARVLVNPYPCGDPSSPTTTTQVQIVTTDGFPVTLDCNAQTSDNPPRATIASNSASLLDTNAVKLTACSFTCSQIGPTDYPIINISFSLKQFSNSSFADQIVLPNSASVDFYTSVTLRNLQR